MTMKSRKKKRTRNRSYAFSSSSFSSSSSCPFCASSCLSSFSLTYQLGPYLGLEQELLAAIGPLLVVFSGFIKSSSPFLQLIFQYQAD
jgi:hypothetical protein